MSDIDVKALREVLAKMSPRPWGRDPNNAGGINCPECPVAFAVRIPPDAEEPGVFWTTADLDGAIACVNAAPALLDRIAALEEGLREALDGWAAWCPPNGSDFGLGYTAADIARLRSLATSGAREESK